jgi:hypothetical protein
MKTAKFGPIGKFEAIAAFQTEKNNSILLYGKRMLLDNNISYRCLN